MRRETQYLAEILEAADAVERFLKGRLREEFLQNEVLQSVVPQKLTVIGEAAARLPRRFADEHFEVDWTDVIGFRNIAVHDCFSVNWSIVRNTAPP
jgi:uncharacterized protein with HEPN domain